MTVCLILFVLVSLSALQAFVTWCRLGRPDFAPLAEELGFNRDYVVFFWNSAWCRLSGVYQGRPVKIVLRATQFGRAFVFDDRKYGLSVSMPCANPRRTRLRVLPKIAKYDVYLEILPPKIEGSWPWSRALEVHGSPESDARSLLERISPDRWKALSKPDVVWGVPSVALSGERCSCETRWDRPLTAAQVSGNLELLAAIAAEAG